MFYDGVINEIWDLNYHMFRIPLLKIDWVKNNGGFGFMLVDLNCLGSEIKLTYIGFSSNIGF